MNLYRIILIAFITFIPLQICFSQNERIDFLNIRLDTNIILIGDQINLTIRATIPENLEIEFPSFTDSITTAIEIIEKYKPDTVKLESKKFFKITHKYLITCFDSGLHFIPPLDFYIKQDHFNNYIQSDSIGLYVATFEIDTTKGFFDIKPPINAPLSWNEIKPYVFIILIIIFFLAILTLLILYIVGKKRNRSFFRKMKPKLPPHEYAFKQLEKTRNKKLYQKKKVKQYYTEITDTLRIYLEERYGIHALEKITTEIVAEVKKQKDITKDTVNTLDRMMRESDLVKFAKKMPLDNENELFWKEVYNFIDTTKMVEITEENKEK